MKVSSDNKSHGTRVPRICALLVFALVAVANAQTSIAPEELLASRFEILDGNVNFTVEPSVSERRYQLQSSDLLPTATWQDVGPAVIGDGTTLVISTPFDPTVPQRFYRLSLDGIPPTPPGFVYIPAGSFQMGDQSVPPRGMADELPVHSVYVSGLYMWRTEVTKAQWDDTSSWGQANGYGWFFAAAQGKASNHPVYGVGWFDVVTWCNARSEQEGLQPCYAAGGAIYRTGLQGREVDCDFTKNGYRLPTEAEWEKAARGGLTAQDFPWGNTIDQSQANYFSTTGGGYHPDYDDPPYPYTSPVGSFAPNGYGLYDVAGNVWEWCWDRFASYPNESLTNPTGPASGSGCVVRGGSWGLMDGSAFFARVAFRQGSQTTSAEGGGDFSHTGFRAARSH